MELKLKFIIDILLVFFILQLYDSNYIVQAQENTDNFLKTAPEFVVVTPSIGSTLNITWDLPNKYELKVNASFNLKYWKRGGDKSSQFVKQYVLDSISPPRLWTILMGLEPDTFYFVQVGPSNNGTTGLESEPVLGRTYRKAPIRSPTSVRISSINGTTVKVSWRPIEISIDEEPVDGYKIRLWEDDGIKTVVRDIIVPSDGKPEGYANNLEGGKVYDIRVLAFSKGGDGKISSPPYSFSLRPLEL